MRVIQEPPKWACLDFLITTFDFFLLTSLTTCMTLCPFLAQGELLRFLILLLSPQISVISLGLRIWINVQCARSSASYCGMYNTIRRAIFGNPPWDACVLSLEIPRYVITCSEWREAFEDI